MEMYASEVQAEETQQLFNSEVVQNQKSQQNLVAGRCMKYFMQVRMWNFTSQFRFFAPRLQT